MRSLFEKFEDAWVCDNVVMDDVIALFQCVGRQITSRDLASVVAQTQVWMNELRPPGHERWEMTQLEASSIEIFEHCMSMLGLRRAIDPARGEYGMGVVLGSTYRGMEPRLNKLIADVVNSLVSIKELIVVTGVRAINDEEKKIFTAAGLDPVGRTEADAALLLLSRTNLPKDIPYVGVASAPNKSDGKRATTEETIFELAQRVKPGSKLLFASHMPFLRQMLTVERALDPTSYRYGVDFTFAGPSKSPSQLVSVIIDEACKLLYELSKRPARTTA